MTIMKIAEWDFRTDETGAGFVAASDIYLPG